MGMDVIGRKPSSETGRYFHNNIAWWHPLASYCEHIAPHITRACQSWHTNDHDGLDAEGACALANILQAAIDNGAVMRLEKLAATDRDTLPKMKCPLCNGSGKLRDTPIPHDAPILRDFPDLRCIHCGGAGTVPDGDYTSFSENNVRDFVAFLQDCGGFSIG